MGKSLSMEYTTMEQEIKNLKKASAAFDTTVIFIVSIVR